jgi:hypothetical protein
MANLIYDKKLSFGKLDPIAGGSFPNVLNLGANGSEAYSRGPTDVDRLTCDLCCAAPAGGTSAVMTVEGSADGSTGWAAVGSNTFTLAQMQGGVCSVAISPNPYQYIRVSLAATGTFTGTAECFLNTYAGK